MTFARRTFCPEDGHACYTPDGDEPIAFTCANAKLCASFEIKTSAGPTSMTQGAIGRLRECPFCGAELEQAEFEEGRYWAHPANSREIGYDCILLDTSVDDNADDFHAWNTRALLTALDGDGLRNTIALIIDANYHTAASKALSTADQIVNAIIGEKPGD